MIMWPWVSKKASWILSNHKPKKRCTVLLLVLPFPGGETAFAALPTSLSNDVFPPKLTFQINAIILELSPMVWQLKALWEKNHTQLQLINDVGNFYSAIHDFQKDASLGNKTHINCIGEWWFKYNKTFLLTEINVTFLQQDFKISLVMPNLVKTFWKFSLRLLNAISTKVDLIWTDPISMSTEVRPFTYKTTGTNKVQ